MTEIGTLRWEDGTLKASSPNLPTLAWTRPADLAEARLSCDPPIEALDVPDGAALLTAAFKVVPFVREPLPKPVYGEPITPAAQAAFDLFLGANTSTCADAFRVLRGELDDFIVCARRYHDVWKVGGFTVEPTTLTVRFEDIWEQLPKNTRFTHYLVEVVRDARTGDTAEQISARVVREVLPNVAPDARVCLDLAANGGFTLTFWPIAGSGTV